MHYDITDLLGPQVRGRVSRQIANTPENRIESRQSERRAKNRGAAEKRPASFTGAESILQDNVEHAERFYSR